MSKLRLGALCVLVATATSGVAIAAPCQGPDRANPPQTAGTPLTLNMALMQVRYAAPNVRRAALEVRARGADADQAGRRLNPSIGFEVENFSGSGPLSGFDQTETTLTFEQTFQLGGKRGKRERASRARAALGKAECEAILRETELEAAITFYELKAAHELADLADEFASLAETLAETVAKRVDAGASAPPELSRSRADAAALKAAALRARAQVVQKRYDLAALWGSADPQFLSPLGTTALEQTALKSNTNITSHPALEVAKAGTDARTAEQEAARAAGIPDLTLSAGLRRFEETGDNAFLLGVSVPIPLFDKNRDAARASGYRTQAARLNIAATETRLRSQQQAAVLQVRVATDQLTLLEGEALPAARSAYQASVTGYSAGRFDLTTTLDARKGLIEAGVAVIDARRDQHTASMQLKSLIGAAPFDGEL